MKAFAIQADSQATVQGVDRNKNLQIVKVPRVQFHLWKRGKSGCEVALVDNSINDTFVNYLKIGNDKHYSLYYGEIISHLQHDFPVFQNLDESSIKFLLWGGDGSSATAREK